MQTIKDVLDQHWEAVLDKQLGRWAKIDAYQEEIPNSSDQDIYACELEWSGKWAYAHVKSLDHHGLRAHEKATLLQVLDVLWLEPSLEHKLIAANDSGYIPAMVELLLSEWIRDHNEITKMIGLIRFKDRQAQWITQEQERQAIEALTKIEKSDQLTIVHLPHSKGATITDRLFGQYKNLLILSWDGEVNFYWDGQLCTALKEKFEWRNGWSWLGTKWGNAYRGGYPKHEEVQNFVSEQLKEKK